MTDPSILMSLILILTPHLLQNPSSRLRSAEDHCLLSDSSATPQDTRLLMTEGTHPLITMGRHTLALQDHTLQGGTMSHHGLKGLTTRVLAGLMGVDHLITTYLRGLMAWGSVIVPTCLMVQ